MALINRVTRLFRADFHAVLDQIEEPGLLLKQAVREMEDELQASEQRIADRKQEQDVLNTRIDEIRSSMANADEQLDVCFESGKDELAKGLIRRKLEAGRILKRLQSRVESNDAFLAGQQTQLEAQRMTLDGLRQKSEVFAQRPVGQRTVFDETAWIAREMTVGDDEVEIAYLREKTRRSAS